MKDIREVLTGGSTALVLKIVGLFVGYIFSLVIARYFGSEGNGVFAIAFTILMVSVILTRLGFDVYLVKLTSENVAADNISQIKYIYTRAVKIVILFSSLAAISLNVLAPVIASTIFKKPELTSTIQFLSLIVIPFTVLDVNNAILRGFKKMTSYSFNAFVGRFLIATIVLLIFVFLNSSPSNSIIIKSFGISVFLLACISSAQVIRQLQTTTKKAIKSITNKTMIFESLPMLLTSGMIFIMGWTDTIFLGIFKSESEVGIYSVSVKIAGVTNFGINAINAIVATKIAEIYSIRDNTRLQKLLTFSSNLAFLSSLPIIILLMLFGDYVLGFFGQEFQSGIVVLSILCIGKLVNSLNGSAGYVLNMTGHQKTVQYIMLISLILNLLLNTLFIQLWGAEGVAIASAISTSFWSITCSIAVKKKLKIISYFTPRKMSFKSIKSFFLKF